MDRSVIVGELLRIAKRLAGDWRHPEPPEGMPYDEWEDEWERLWRKPIDATKYDVLLYEPEAPGRGEVQIRLPRDWDDDLVDELENSLGGGGVQVYHRGRSLTFMLDKPRQIKADLAARIIRRWKQRREGLI